MKALKRKYLYMMLSAMAVACLSSCNLGSKYNWFESYSNESKEPYGTYIVYNLLEGYNNGKLHTIDHALHKTLIPSQVKDPSCYVFIGQSLYLGNQGADSLLEFVNRGNDAFISAKQLPEELSRKFRSIGCSYESYGTITSGESDSIVTLNFYHPALLKSEGYDYSFFYRNKRLSYRWYYVNTSGICDSAHVISYLGYFGHDKVNFIRIPYGKGYFYVQTTPLVFTNYFMVNKASLEYAAKAFSHITRKNIYWDEFSRIPLNDNEEDSDKRETPFRYILSQPPLKWALYLTLILLFVYIIFRSRRKQRVIPILEEKENTSLEFVQTIGTLYFQQNEHRKLAIQKMKLFLQFIRNRYSIPTNNVNEEMMRKIAVKSQVPYSSVSSIFEQYQWIESMPEISDTNLITFHQSIDNFYKTCK